MIGDTDKDSYDTKSRTYWKIYRQFLGWKKTEERGIELLWRCVTPFLCVRKHTWQIPCGWMKIWKGRRKRPLETAKLKKKSPAHLSPFAHFFFLERRQKVKLFGQRSEKRDPKTIPTFQSKINEKPLVDSRSQKRCRLNFRLYQQEKLLLQKKLEVNS